ncbi:MAG: MBL fold metallo-hydrolase [Chloroflexi bacterium]|nr:MBL fold metallo-hydrolase [Chloroflexota bacterium]
MLEIVTFQLGPVITNAYLVADNNTKEAVVIDPAWDGQIILAEAQKRGWAIRCLWVTHAHFDHMGGTKALVDGLIPAPGVALHPNDLPLWRAKGGAPFFGIRFDSITEPNLMLEHGQKLQLGDHPVEVRHAPGHTRGHVIFYFPEDRALFSGDVIFQGSVGRTDLPGGAWDTLLASIETQVLTLPDETKVFSGHGPATSVGRERRGNPFLG